MQKLMAERWWWCRCLPLGKMMGFNRWCALCRYRVVAYPCKHCRVGFCDVCRQEVGCPRCDGYTCCELCWWTLIHSLDGCPVCGYIGNHQIDGEVEVDLRTARSSTMHDMVGSTIGLLPWHPEWTCSERPRRPPTSASWERYEKLSLLWAYLF